jgi:hypothetical protein
MARDVVCSGQTANASRPPSAALSLIISQAAADKNGRGRACSVPLGIRPVTRRRAWQDYASDLADHCASGSSAAARTRGSAACIAGPRSSMAGARGRRRVLQRCGACARAGVGMGSDADRSYGDVKAMLAQEKARGPTASTRSQS